MNGLRQGIRQLLLGIVSRPADDGAPASPNWWPIGLGLALGLALAFLILSPLGFRFRLESILVGAIGMAVVLAVGSRRDRSHR